MLCRGAKTDTFYGAVGESGFNIISLGASSDMAARTEQDKSFARLIQIGIAYVAL
jgi:hypothetical protein